MWHFDVLTSLWDNQLLWHCHWGWSWRCIKLPLTIKLPSVSTHIDAFSWGIWRIQLTSKFECIWLEIIWHLFMCDAKIFASHGQIYGFSKAFPTFHPTSHLTSDIRSDIWSNIWSHWSRSNSLENRLKISSSSHFGSQHLKCEALWTCALCNTFLSIDCNCRLTSTTLWAIWQMIWLWVIAISFAIWPI